MSDRRRDWERRSGGRVTRASDTLQHALSTHLGTSTSSSTYQPYSSSSSTSATALGSPFTYTGSASTYGGSSSRYDSLSTSSARPSSSPFRFHPT
ncbi:hypothetical protein C8A01DRAFT_36437 [Parachaetomium inaequale]|uniref:Uncharacterized protein n=1 Tax=Parachaetomium inaequale TaxID=2588326 RepID=A0AAN6PEM6_9PEZI|nr:hypothetical protein C8A01DRAFT_36437 [Parachaetomium inaequale]